MPGVQDNVDDVLPVDALRAVAAAGGDTGVTETLVEYAEDSRSS